ncbi:MAG TPA: potassium-transporting ATPase subunit C [Gemmataceae bacterium]|nr:potassium-transporting ATPase subunit C [Gemmataceae bacterium]
MNAHLRANLWLLGLTVLICCVLYPLTLWAIGQSVFPDKASGSLVMDEGGKAVGSRLIAQPFNSDEYFRPRPSAASYNGGASAGSNYGPNNPKLRYRVAQALGPIVKYRSGPKKDQLAGPDIEKWFQQDRFQGKPHLVAQWAKRYPSSAQDWVKADKLNSEYVHAWQNVSIPHPHKELEEWRKENPDVSDPKSEDLAVPFFVSWSHMFPGTWPGTVEVQEDGKTKKKIMPVKEDAYIQANFFDMWLQDNPHVELVEVPADMVMASGSGLDPHITLANAHYQLDRVVDAWVKKTGGDPAKVRSAIEDLLKQKAAAPFGGLAGVKLINVLEINLELPGVMKRLAKESGGNGGPA